MTDINIVLSNCNEPITSASAVVPQAMARASPTSVLLSTN